MGLIRQRTSNASDSLAVDTADKAYEAGDRVLMLRFNQKRFGDYEGSGAPVNAFNTGVVAVENTGHWRFVQVSVVEDNDRLAFFALFERPTEMDSSLRLPPVNTYAAGTRG